MSLPLTLPTTSLESDNSPDRVPESVARRRNPNWVGGTMGDVRCHGDFWVETV